MCLYACEFRPLQEDGEGKNDSELGDEVDDGKPSAVEWSQEVAANSWLGHTYTKI